MASKRIKKKREKIRQEKQLTSLILEAAPFIETGDLRKLQKGAKDMATRMRAISKLQALSGYLEERRTTINDWRNRGAKIKYGKVKFHNVLENMDKYHLIKHYWTLVKEGHIKHDSSLAYYDDVADWSLDNMSDEELQKVISEAEDRKAKISMREFGEMVQF